MIEFTASGEKLPTDTMYPERHSGRTIMRPGMARSPGTVVGGAGGVVACGCVVGGVVGLGTNVVLGAVGVAVARTAKGDSAVVRDTRRTMPGLRALEKYAVRCGGGTNHRMGLSDMALVKDNHVAAAGGVSEAFRRVRAIAPSIPLEIEVDTLDGLREAIAAGADEVLIDNFTAR